MVPTILSLLKSIYLAGIVALVLTGCSDTSENLQTSVPKLHHQAHWYHTAKDFFIDDKVEIADFSARLSQYTVGITDANQNSMFPTPELKGLLPLSAALAAEEGGQTDASVGRLTKRFKLFLAHQLTFYGQAFLSSSDRQIISQQEYLTNYLLSLQMLVEDYPSFVKGEFDVYDYDEDKKLLAYSRIIERTRAYVVFNLSFDIHPMPLPLGFMASTKIKLWQSNNTEWREFVTDSPLVIHPLTAAIVIVD